MKKLGYMAVSNCGSVLHLHGLEHPRKSILKQLGASSAEKMYVDDKEGNAKHIGYIVGDEWFTVYEVHEWQGKVTP